MKQWTIHYHPVTKTLLIINTIVALIYLAWWFDFSHISNPYMYGALFFGEIYHVFMAISFWYTIWPGTNPIKQQLLPRRKFQPSVDIFITVAGEPVSVVRQTASAAKNIRYPNHNVYLLNDGFVAKKDNWQDIEKLAKELKINCITRKISGGAKAGNINNALKKTQGEIIVIFDADMVPEPHFLSATIPYLAHPQVGFVQSPQFYKNTAANQIAAAAWEQQEFFFGPILRGKDKDNTAFICGTNVAIRRQALEQAGGMAEDNIAEDFLTSLVIHQQGWKSVYVPDVLATGLAPEDLLSYFKQQLRWARGSLEITFSQNPIFKNGLTFAQRLQYLSSSLYYFNGVIVVIDMIMPLLFLFFGWVPVSATTTSFAIFFIPFMWFSLFTIYRVSQGSLTFRAISFSLSSWYLQLLALFSLLSGKKMGFSVTPKHAQEGNFIYLAYPHLIYVLLAIVGSTYAIYRHGLSPAISANIVWALFNVIMFIPFISASYNWKSLFRNVPKSKTHIVENPI